MAEPISLTLHRLAIEKAARQAYASRARLWRALEALAATTGHKPPTDVLEARKPYWSQR